MKQINLDFNHFFSSIDNQSVMIKNLPLDCLSLLFEFSSSPLVLLIPDLKFETAVKYLSIQKNCDSIAFIPPETDCFNEPGGFNVSKRDFLHSAKEVFSSGVDSVPLVLCAMSGINTPVANLHSNSNPVLSNNLSFDSCINFLNKNNYVAAEITTSKGDYSIRGGIIDVFTRARQHPLR